MHPWRAIAASFLTTCASLCARCVAARVPGHEGVLPAHTQSPPASLYARPRAHGISLKRYLRSAGLTAPQESTPGPCCQAAATAVSAGEPSPSASRQLGQYASYLRLQWAGAIAEQRTVSAPRTWSPGQAPSPALRACWSPKHRVRNPLTQATRRRAARGGRAVAGGAARSAEAAARAPRRRPRPGAVRRRARGGLLRRPGRAARR
jgi:hypothetical protein